ncbi:MAG: hypothetical protein OEZ55_03220 [Nitrospinota bacterium]|nr:hypothetical protein [Nitrospinota bacterium]MDH5755661.1 hypothetical protein [Nitrospinota bacterium]
MGWKLSLLGSRRRCSFCGRSEAEVSRLVEGPTVRICVECLEACNEVIRKERKELLVRKQKEEEK